MSLYKQIWLDAVKDGFYTNAGFASRATDMSTFVENDKINLAELGVTPEVYMNSAGPFNPVNVDDVHIELELRRFDSQSTRIKNADRVELAYDQVKAYTDKHQKSILDFMRKRAAFEYAPTSHTNNTPILKTSGVANALGLKKIRMADIIALHKAYNDNDWPEEGRILVLNPLHFAELLEEDATLLKVFANVQQGTLAPKLYSFDVYQFSKTPTYDVTSAPVKNAFGAAGNPASIAYMETEVMRAEGSWMMHHATAEQDPVYRADTIGFSCRGLHLPIRAISQSAIVSI